MGCFGRVDKEYSVHLFYLLLFYALLGSVAGLLSGLLGIGGGIVVVPALVFIFNHEKVPDAFVMQMAVGTSLAIMVATTLRTLIAHTAHSRNRQLFLQLAKIMLPAVFVGVIIGASIAGYIHSDILRVSFGVLVLFVAVRLLLFSQAKVGDCTLPGVWWQRFAGVIMGMLSGMLGIGGGTTVIPYMLHFQVKMRIALQVAISAGLVVSSVGAVVYALAGMGVKGLPPDTIGYIYWPAWIGTATGSVLLAPFGTRLSYFLPASLLKKLFALLMLLIGFHMILSA